MLTRRTTFRLYPSKAQEVKLFEVRRLHAYLYNACVEDRKTSYQKFGKSIDYFDQQAALVPFKTDWEEYADIPNFNRFGSIQVGPIRMLVKGSRFTVRALTGIWN